MTTFAELGLDPRLLRALDKKEFETPTPVQASFTETKLPQLVQSVSRTCTEYSTGAAC